MDQFIDLTAVNIMHQLAHEAEKDFDDTIVVALPRRDYVLFMTGIDILANIFPCLFEDLQDLTERLIELRKAQKPEWTPGEYGDQD